MRIKISSTLVLGLIGGMLAGCGNGGSQDSLTNTSSTSSKLLSRHVKAAACVAWVSGGTYTAGEVVTYNGANYTALVTQTDYAGTGWNPTVASLFSPGGSCGGTPTPTPAPTPAPAPTPTPTPSGPAGYTFCANENGTCNLSGANTVAFGANGDFNYQTITGNASCTDTVFGDPDVGVVKACYYLPAPAPTPTPAGPTGPAGYTFCANENGTCNLFGSNTVAFGANGKFNYQSITGNVSCANTVFGDPDVGVVKACFYTSTPGLTSGASYNFVNPESNLVLDEAGCGTSNGTNVQLWANGVGACNGGAGQIWVPTLNSDGTYTITNPGSNMVLDLAGCGGAGANVDMWANGVGVCNGGAGQKWAFTLNSDGTYTITNPSSGLALDVASCGTTNGTNVDVWTNGVNVCNGGGGQKWQPVPPTTTPTPTQISWPSSQLLPSFPAPAGTMDLYQLQAPAAVWLATGTALSHQTGHLDTDGWLCQVGIDTPNAFMIYGPYDTSLPSGPNTAVFNLMIDNNTADNAAQVELDVRDATTGQILNSETVTRQQFTAASTYLPFSLPFTKPNNTDSLELRVYWLGGAYIKVNSVSATRTKSSDDLTMMASLKGIVNATQPRIFSYEGDANAEGPYTWLQSLGLGWNDVTSNYWSLITKYRSQLNGIVVYDDTLRDTINLADIIAHNQNALVASPSQASILTAAPYNLPILADLRGQYTSSLAVYQTIYNTYWPTLTHRVLFGLDPNGVLGSSREYATAIGAAAVWLDPRDASQGALLNQFMSSMGAGTVYMGWWPDEASGVTAASQYGIATVASDFSTNLTMHSGMPRSVAVKATPPVPALQNKIYVGFVMSDGDNLQYVEHLLRKLWNDPGRGQVPMGWTMSPAMLDAMPGALNYYYETASANDNLVSGPSGYGYTYPNSWPSQTQLNQFESRTEDYVSRAGFRVVTVWNTITGGINANVGQSYAANAPYLLGLTAQNTGGGLTIYNNSLPGLAFACNYCASQSYIQSSIASAAAGWNGNSPLFILIQAQPWQGVTPTSFLNVMNALGSNYVVVRPDNFFQLLRQANGLPFN